MSEAQDWNSQIIAEFRANAGKVGGQFEGAPMLLLHSIGAKSGLPRTNPLMYQKVDGGWAIFASKAGAPTNPDWYYNLLAHPETAIEVGSEEIPAKARVADATERVVIMEEQKRRYPGFADYERMTTRVIPVVILQRSD
jgi:deazaflavin-dependent oxidoreductase (nitroreductase family)